MIQSMTGYASGDRAVGADGAAAIHLELKSVNSRFLDVVFRCGDELRFLEMPLRELLTARIHRGKVECRLHLIPRQGGARRELTLDTGLVDQLGRLEVAVRAALPDAEPLSVAEVLRWPGMLGDDSLDPALLQGEAVTLAGTVIDELDRKSVV